MDPISAMGCAASVIQFVDFGRKLVSGSLEIYRSADGMSAEHVSIEDISRGLSELIIPLRARSDTRLDNVRNANKNRSKEKLSVAEKELNRICKDCDDVAQQLLQELDKIRLHGRHRKWRSFRHALGNMWNQSQITALEKKLERIHKQVDTTLLVCLRERIDASPDNGASRLNDDIMQAIEENRQWQAELLDEISKNNWHAENPKDMSTFSAHLNRSVKLESEAQFCRKAIAFLGFPSMSDRQERICKNHRATFDWIFKDPSIIDKPWDDFVKWLSSDNSDAIYWITGKAGSGKSTLMRFISEDQRTMKHLKLWAKGNPLVIGSFFFWNSGTAMQMSRTGLMQSLLYQMLRDRPDHILKTFQTRWEAYDSLRGGSYPWTWTELKQAFQLVLLDKSLRFFFLIDGLDEFDGQHRELVDLIISASKLSNVKICVSSRPWIVFEDAFEGHPSLLLEQLSYSDIKLYVCDKFDDNKRYVQLKSREGTYAADLVESVVQKASGVFLWVYLVVDSLLRGLDNADRVSDLQRRLDLIPSGLEELFDKMLNSLEPFYFSHACQLIQIFRASQKLLTLLWLSFADEDDPLSAIQAKIEPLSEEQRLERIEMMRRRLKSRCKGLIEAPVSNWRCNESGADSYIEYIHRTAKDFLESPDIWSKILRGAGNSFDPNRCLCNSFLFRLKTTPPTYIHELYWGLLSWCLEYATQVELSSGDAPITYIDERTLVALEHPSLRVNSELHTSRRPLRSLLIYDYQS
ncbi:hypothetical protein VE04_02112 [Pseudogymnoascus sp. 24MN13]|nr:hypothetical protein VE04_02112 [Pseudogymnoascus sp. 24MN13]